MTGCTFTESIVEKAAHHCELLSRFISIGFQVNTKKWKGCI